METRLAMLTARRDRFLAVGKAALLLCAILWLASITFYDTAADPPLDRPKILLSSRLSFAMALAEVDDLHIRRIWGGPATLFGLGSFAASLLILGLAVLARARLNHQSFSRTGAALVLLSLPLWVYYLDAARVAGHPTYVRIDGFERLVAFIETRQPGTIARLRAGERLSLPHNEGGRFLFGLTPAGGQHFRLEDTPPLHDQIDAESLRFALAQQALFAGDYTTLRRMLPIDLGVLPADQPAGNDIARRLTQMGRAVGVSPVPPGQERRIEQGEVRWQLSLRLIRANRVLIQLTLVAGLITLLIGMILRRRIGRIEHYAAGSRPSLAPASPATLREVTGT